MSLPARVAPRRQVFRSSSTICRRGALGHEEHDARTTVMYIKGCSADQSAVVRRTSVLSRALPSAATSKRYVVWVRTKHAHGRLVQKDDSGRNCDARSHEAKASRKGGDLSLYSGELSVFATWTCNTPRGVVCRARTVSSNVHSLRIYFRTNQ